MKIIISHDVDGLYGKDHWFRDLHYPKLWVRETLWMLRGKITASEWFGRCISCFAKKRNRIPELIEYDLEHGIRSTFFFGMAQGLGMSYKPNEARSMIQYVKDHGLDVGVHGICYTDEKGIIAEKQTFEELMGFAPNGIRMHYVRFDDQTFSKLDKAGYCFDSTEFNKQTGTCVKAPYKVGAMWEFPVCVMDSYLPYNFEQAKQMTLDALQKAKENDVSYFTVLLHDPHFSKEYKEYKQWYEWLISYLSSADETSFVSFMDAVRELEAQ